MKSLLKIDFFSKKTEKVQFLWPFEKAKLGAIVFIAIYNTHRINV